MAPHRQHHPRLPQILWLLALLGSAPATGQVLTSIEFSFSNPGARSMGFGGAFVALADDATAAFANPAGLVQLTRPEISLEGRSWSYRTPYVRGGRAAGQPTGLGIDTAPNVLLGESTDDLAAPEGARFEVGEAVLFRSELRPGGALYTVLERVPLGGES